MEHFEVIGSANPPSRSTPDPFPVGGLGAVLRRTIIACDGSLALEDQLDCADMACALGYWDAARMLYQGVFVLRGFSAKQIASQARIAARTRLWPEEAWPGDVPAPAQADFAVDLALVELRGMIELASEAPLSPLPAIDIPGMVSQHTSSGETASHDGAQPIDPALVMALCERLCACLRSNDVTRLGTVLDDLRDNWLGRPRWQSRDHVDASITDLAAGVVANQLQAFFRRNHELCWEPFGSSAMFAAAARLSDGGLGPYFGNVKNLLRSERDLMGLALIAGADDGTGRGARFQRWIVLLSTYLDGGDRIGLADDLADRGLSIALTGIFGRTWQEAPDRGSRLPWIIRDAALDLGLVDLAAQAQARIVGFSPDRVEEWIVLAEVLGGDDRVAAKHALAEALRLSPLDKHALRLSAALEADDFGAFEALSGVASPSWRTALRARHRVPKEQPGEADVRKEAVAA